MLLSDAISTPHSAFRQTVAAKATNASRRTSLMPRQSGEYASIRDPGSITEYEMKDFRDLRVWQKAHQLTLTVYEVTRRFLREELFGLTSQMRRCASSISANLAEGCGKHGNGEFRRFLDIACGSASELEYHFLLARDLPLVDDPQFKTLRHGAIEVKMMLAGLIQKVHSDRLAG